MLFCDTSALVKLYVSEEFSDRMISTASASDAIAACRVAWVEFMAAMARRAREQPEDAAALASATSRFATDWPQCFVVELDRDLSELAGEYAEAFALRAYDSVQLAAVHTVHREMPGEVRFACYDNRLAKAARGLGIDSI